MGLGHIGREIEQLVMGIYGFSDDPAGFDCRCNNTPVEVIGCLKEHLNGTSKEGRQKFTKGRFWIDIKKHVDLLGRGGEYAFALYEIKDNRVVIVKTVTLTALFISTLMNGRDNAKISYDKIFTDEKEAVLW